MFYRFYIQLIYLESIARIFQIKIVWVRGYCKAKISGQLRGSYNVMRGSRPCQVKFELCPLGGEEQLELELLATKHPEPQKSIVER